MGEIELTARRGGGCGGQLVAEGVEVVSRYLAAVLRSLEEAARQELGRASLLSNKLGMQPLSAQAHFLLATIARDSGNASDAQDHYREALRLLDAMKKDPGAEKALQRADFKSINEEAKRATLAVKN